MNTGLSVPGRTARLLAGRLRPLIGAGSRGQRNASDEECSSISSVNGSRFDGRAEAVVVRGCGQAEVRALLTVLQMAPYLHCNARFDMPSRVLLY